MNEEQTIINISDLVPVQAQIDYSPLIFEFSGTAIFLAAVFFLFNYTKRPGRALMFYGFLLSKLSNIPWYLFVYTDVLNESSEWVSSYMPTASTVFWLVGCVGLLLFALSFRNES